MIAALYVDPRGVYSGRPGVEPWGLPDRDARELAACVVDHPDARARALAEPDGHGPNGEPSWLLILGIL